MITVIVIALASILLIAPLRGALLGHGAWRFTLPALAGLGGAWVGWSYIRAMPAPVGYEWLWLAAPAFGALVIAGTVWTCLNDVFGPRQDRR